MRIQHHVSIILLVAIGGAVALAVTVGVLMGGVERAARAAGTAAEQYQQVGSVVTTGRDLKKNVKSLTLASSPLDFTMLDRSIERSIIDLVKLRSSSLLADQVPVEEAILSIETLGRQARRLAVRSTAGTLEETELTSFGEGIEYYLSRVDVIEANAKEVAERTDFMLTLRQRLIMVAIGVICILYLAVIERVRHWTTRRLIHPVQMLAGAAMQALEDEDAFRGLEGGSTEELNTLARVLSSFVDTLKRRVRERTAEVERQKEHLEREVAVRRRAEDQLRHAAFHDKLTGLCNRDLLLDRLERCMERARRHPEYNFAVLFLDVDRFKEVNDSLGHFVGDQLLVAIAERLQNCLRGTDSLSRVESNTIARIGGDEFVILLDGISDRPAASSVAERVQEVISEPFRLQGNEVFTSASIGIAFNEIECEKADHMLRDADTAMYYAKAAGKARHEVFNTTMHEEATSRLKLHNDLKRAVEKHEFEVCYQPIIALEGGCLAGFEVLVRWEHPEKGTVDPVEFISHAEETGAIVKIGQFVLRQACTQLREWREEGLADNKLSMSVNVSKRQVAHPGFVQEVREILEETRIPGTDIKLEITETVIMENPDSITEVLEQLRELGVQIHMDDFGTGYSSLSYLHRFPLDLLKIDRAFMGSMAMNKDYREVVATVVALAHTLNMQVTVEGVETEDQLAQLQELNCDYGQGFYFSRPLSPPEASKILVKEPEWLNTAA